MGKTIMKNDNRGVSLVEMIVIMAIMSILIGAGVLGLQMISTKPAKQLAYNIESAIENGRITALAKAAGGYELKIHYDTSDKCYYLLETIEGVSFSKNIGGKGVEVKYRLDGVIDPITIDGLGANDLVIKFNRATGGLDLSGSIVESIDISKSSKHFELTIYRLTGKVILREL